MDLNPLLEKVEQKLRPAFRKSGAKIIKNA